MTLFQGQITSLGLYFICQVGSGCLQPSLSSLEKQVSVKATYYYYPQEESQEGSTEFPPLAPSRAQACRATGFSQEPGLANPRGIGGKAFNLMAPALWGPGVYPSFDSCQTSSRQNPTLCINMQSRGIWSCSRITCERRGSLPLPPRLPLSFKALTDSLPRDISDSVVSHIISAHVLGRPLCSRSICTC